MGDGLAIFKMRVVIIGGGSAGTTCAFELRKLNKEVEITLIEKSSNLEYSPCALPYILSGEIKSFEKIFIFNKKDYEDNSIDLLLNSEVEKINTKDKKVIVKDKREIDYDKLVIAVGGSCFVPKIKGLEDTNYNVFKTIEDTKEISKIVKQKGNLAIIGAGMIGMELAFSLVEKGNKVSVFETQENILPNILDLDMSEKLKEYLENYKIKVFENCNIKEISCNKIVLDDEEVKFDSLFLCTGIKPNLSFLKEAGIKIDKGIVVNGSLETSNKDVYACGDCVESFEFNTNEKVFSQLGTTAVRQARVVARNILGEREELAHVLNNAISKLGEIYVGTVGITEKRAKKLGIKSVCAKYTGNVRAEYYPSKEKITIKLICNVKGEVIGGQIIGEGEVVGRLDLIALAIQKKVKVEDIAKLETCYNPALAPIFDPLTIVAEICVKKLKLLK
jgi:NADH oxidase (H2O2-forming)